MASGTVMDIQETKLVLDSTIATGAITMPLWVTELQGWIGLGISIGGLILIIMRIMIAIKDWKKDT